MECRSVELSAVTYMEFVQGMRNKKEPRLLRQTIRLSEWPILLLTHLYHYEP